MVYDMFRPPGYIMLYPFIKILWFIIFSYSRKSSGLDGSTAFSMTCQLRNPSAPRHP